MTNSVAQNIATINDQIKKVCVENNRDPTTITLVAVSKTHPASIIQDLHKESGHIHYGENYVQELSQKIELLNNPEIAWHFIGHLQRNKAKYIVGKTHLIHTLDRLSLANTIEKLALEKNIVQNCLIQVKLSNEDSKLGCDPKDVNELLKALNEYNHINVKGLMLIGTWSDDKFVNQKEFKELRKMRDNINAHKIYKNKLTELSMGMSSDFDVAIKEGASILRIGTDIFGKR